MKTIVAKALNGRKYRNETTQEIEKLAKENNLVIVFGSSDDCIELRGAIEEEVYDTFYLDRNGLIENDCDDEDCPYFQRIIQSATHIQPEYCNYPEMPNGWMFKFNKPIPYEAFDIFEDDEVFCKGIVFDLGDM